MNALLLCWRLDIWRSKLNLINHKLKAIKPNKKMLVRRKILPFFSLFLLFANFNPLSKTQSKSKMKCTIRFLLSNFLSRFVTHFDIRSNTLKLTQFFVFVIFGKDNPILFQATKMIEVFTLATTFSHWFCANRIENLFLQIVYCVKKNESKSLH